MNEVVAEPELTVEAAESQLVIAPADREVLSRISEVTTTLDHLMTPPFSSLINLIRRINGFN